jgi:hypothetical protein
VVTLNDLLVELQERRIKLALEYMGTASGSMVSIQGLLIAAGRVQELGDLIVLVEQKIEAGEKDDIGDYEENAARRQFGGD